MFSWDPPPPEGPGEGQFSFKNQWFWAGFGGRSEALSKGSQAGVCEINTHRNPINSQVLGPWVSPSNIHAYGWVTPMASNLIIEIHKFVTSVVFAVPGAGAVL